MTTIPLALIGMGRMGRALAALAPERGFQVVAELDPARPDYAGITRETLRGAQVAIEFTTPEAAPANARACAASQCPVVVGTTGWYDQLPAISAEVERAGGGMLTAPNFSVGVAVFDRVVAEAARLFGRLEGFDAHLVETHHAAKKDAPSGTALALARAVAASGLTVDVSSTRAGHIPGTHTVGFDSPAETIALTHTARDRTPFARGALEAAKWIRGRRGWFTMADMLGL